jgi:hypothetical protein
LRLAVPNKHTNEIKYKFRQYSYCAYCGSYGSLGSQDVGTRASVVLTSVFRPPYEESTFIQIRGTRAETCGDANTEIRCPLPVFWNICKKLVRHALSETADSFVKCLQIAVTLQISFSPLLLTYEQNPVAPPVNYNTERQTYSKQLCISRRSFEAKVPPLISV